MAIQMQEMDKDIKESTSLQRMKTMYASQTNHPSQRWLQTIGQAYLKKNGIFSIQNFNTFVDDFTNHQTSLNDAYKQYEETFDSLRVSSKNTPKDLNKSIKKTKILSEADMSEVQSVVDNMILILEVQDEIESQVRLDFNWIDIDLHIEKVLDKNLLMGSPSKLSSIPKSNSMVLLETYKATTGINTSHIFTTKYIRKLQALVQPSNAIEQASTNFIMCDSKLLQKILSINEGSNISSKVSNDLIIDLTTLFLNTYNYCGYLKEKK